MKHIQILQAVVNRLIPADEFANGWDAGVGDYLARHWEGDLSAQTAMIEQGLETLQAISLQQHGAPFPTLQPAEQDALLHKLAQSSDATYADVAWTVSPATFVQTLAELAAEGYYSDPQNGGNRDQVSWHMLTYRSGPNPVHDPTTFAPSPHIEVASLSAVAPEYDAIVIGAGAAGGIVACMLAEAGQQVLLIERGRWQPFAQSGRDHLRNHRLALYGHNTGPDLAGNPRVFEDAQGQEHVIAPHQAGYHNNAMGVGGGTRVYGAQAWRFLPQDFRMASEYGTPAQSSLADWPISYADLAPYYEQAEWEIGVSGQANPAFHASPRQKGYPMPPVPDSPKRRLLQQGAEKLHWHTEPAPLLINTSDYLGRPACVQCGMCVGFACPSESKNGTHNTVIPRALATGNCTLLTEAQVQRIETDSQGQATGVTFFKEEAGQVEERTVRARVVVSSAGAIESARLLLNSASRQEPEGLGNRHDQVGRHLQGHHYPGAFGLFDEEIEDNNGPGVTIATCDFNHGNPGIIGGGMLANEFIKLPIIFWRSSLPPELPRWGLENKSYMRHAFRRTVQVQGPIQEIPNPAARVTVAPHVRDRFGIPVARLSGVSHPESVRTAEFMRQRAIQWLAASGAQRIWSTPVSQRLSAGQHQAGTCRMGSDPTTSVTDEWGRVHGHTNLFVVDGSLHVTNGGFNPVLTIMALAFRCAQAIGEQLAR